MVTATATATQMQNNFGKYLGMALDGGEVVITKNGKEVARLISKDAAATSLTDSLTGIISLSDADMGEDLRDAALGSKYEVAD